jgi:type I restriction enzyme S subunit
MKPGYKQTEVGIIPEEWCCESLSNLCVKIQDGTHFSPTIRGNDYLYVTSKNIRFGYLDISTADRIDADQHDVIYKRCDVKHGDLLLTKDGANTGNAALNNLNEQFSLLSSVALLRFDAQKHSAAFFLQQCLSAQGQQRMKDAMSGNAITRLTLEKIRKLKFPVCSLPEQRAIAEALSDVDGLLGGLDRLIAKKRDLKQAAMQQLLTGQTRLPGFQGEWEVKRLGDVATLNRLNVVPACSPSQMFVHFSLPAFDTGKAPVLELGSAIKSNKFRVSAGAVLVSKLNPRIPRVWAPDCIPEESIASTEFLVLMPKDKVSRSFLFFLCASPRFCEQMELAATGTTGSHQRISPSGALTLQVFVPTDRYEQAAIADMLTEMDLELEALEQRREKTRALKQGMMQELLTGRIRIV